MEKNFFKYVLFGVFAMALSFSFVSCGEDYDDDIAALQKQIDENKTAINDLNTKIGSGLSISSITPIANGIKITLSNGDSHEITNGTKGDKGDNGTAGSVVTIGENGNWFIDGNDTGKSAKGDKGDTGDAGATGEFTIGENGHLYIGTDDTGITVGGNITAVVKDGVLTLFGVDGLEEGYKIYMTNDLRSLVFVPQVYVDGVQGMTYESYSYRPLTLESKDSKNEKAIIGGLDSEVVINPVVYAEYHVNPSNATLNIEEVKDEEGNVTKVLKDKLTFKVRTVDYIDSRAAASEDFSVTPEFISFEKGILKVKVDITGIAGTGDKISVAALNVEKEDGQHVTSDYATLYKKDLPDLAIADPAECAKAKGIVNWDEHYRRYIAKVDDEAYNKKIVWSEGTDLPTSKLICDTSVVYNSSLDLNKIVEAHVLACDADGQAKISVANLAKLGLKFEFDIVENYKIGNPVTDQKDFVKKLEADNIFTPTVYDSELEDGTGRAAIGRTPIVRVRLMHGANIVKVAYIKVYISDKPGVTEDPKQYEVSFADFVFNCEDVTGLSKVKDMNVNVYDIIGMSKDDFHRTYPLFEDYGSTQTPADLGVCAETEDPETQATHVIKWKLTAAELWENAGEKVTHRVRYYKSEETKEDIYVELLLTSKVTAISKEYNVDKADFINNYWNADKTFTKFNVAVPTSTTDVNPDNCTFINDLNSPFITWPANTKPGEGTPGVLKLDKAVTGIKYFFCTDDIKSIKKIGDIDVVFSVSIDGLTLYATVGGKKEVVAVIDNYGSILPNTVTYNKDSDIAKLLLNTADMHTYIGATGRVCDDDTKVVTITFDGKDHFRANFVRPVNISEKAADNFIDAVDFGEKGSFIRLEDLIAPYDWRDRYFSDYTNYWGFYGPFKITVDIESAQCDLNGVRQGIPVTVELKADYTTMTMGTGKDKLVSEHGFITYKNNGTNVSAFNIFVKVAVDYGWGTIKTGYITVPVDSTIIGEN